MNKRITKISIIVLLLLFYAVPAKADIFLLRNLRGNIDVSGNQSDIVYYDDSTGEKITYDSETLNQKYNLRWSWMKALFENITLQTSVNYQARGNKTGQTDLWNSEFQPTVDLRLNYSLFTLNNSYSHRISERDISSDTSTTLKRDYFVTRLSTNIKKVPMQFGYTFDHTFNVEDTRDQYDNRFTINANKNLTNNDFIYNFSFFRSDDRIRSRLSDSYKHFFRWGQFRTFKDDKINLSSNYSLDYSSIKVKQSDTLGTLTEVTIDNILYAEDETPGFGELETVNGLNDGNLLTSSSPRIELGTGNVNRNIGVETSFGRSISAMYIYTSTFSSNNLSWDLYVSDDNLEWSRVETNVTSYFDLTYNRYELIFDERSEKYIKVVNQGLNTVDSVFVTEVVGLIDKDYLDSNEYSSVNHSLDIYSNYRVNEKFNSQANISYNYNKNNATDYSRSQLSMNLVEKYKASEKINHTVRIQSMYQTTSSTEQNSQNLILNYNLSYDPMNTLNLSFSLNDVMSLYDWDRYQDIKSAYIQATGDMFPGLRVTSAINYTYNKQLSTQVNYNSWSYRLTFEGDLTRNIDFITTYNHNYSKRSGSFDPVVRNNYYINLNYRLTQNIFIRGTGDITVEEETFFSHYYLLSWNMTEKLTISSQIRYEERGDLNNSDRYSINSTYNLSKRASLTIGFDYSDFTDMGGRETTSVLLGFRTGF